MSYPTCPDPSHGGSRVVRAGRYGKPPYRRQRWRCVPANGSPPHRFAETLPRHLAHESHCAECSSRLDPWEGQAVPRRYLYDAREIARVLTLIAHGLSYRSAAENARRNFPDRKARTSNPRSSRRRRGEISGQLAANWLDVFGGVACAGDLPGHWPERLVIDSLSFRTGGVSGVGLYFFVAVGYDPPNYLPQVWLIRPYPHKTVGSWRAFFTELDGTPQRIVSDLDGPIAKAIEDEFPRAGDPPPQHYWCEHHLRQLIEKYLVQLPATHPIRSQVDAGALRSLVAWDAFEQAVWQEHTTGVALPIMTKWLSHNGARMARQIQTRPRSVPHSVGAVEAVNLKLKQRLSGRARRLGNRARTELMLDLMTCDFRHEVDELQWAARIRRHLEAMGGTPQTQHGHGDPRGRPSLYP